MITLSDTLQPYLEKATLELFDVQTSQFEFQATRREFEGDITVVIFPLLKQIKGNPVDIGNKIGDYLLQNVPMVSKYNVVKGFLNLLMDDAYYLDFFNEIYPKPQFGFVPADAHSKTMMVEFASPNTNKPLHLGHIRNILLGFSTAQILKAAGYHVNKTQIINDRGIHICKSMLAWQKFGEGQTPESTGLKGDKLVGNFYVKFETEFQNEYSIWCNTDEYLEEFKKDKNTPVYEKLENEDGENHDFNLEVVNSDEDIDFSNNGLHKDFKSNFKDKYFRNYSSIGKEAQEMLRKWEAGDAEVVALWQKMNQWVYDGFAVTYKNLGVDFDSYYYESDTYLLGKEVVEIGLQKEVFYKKEDGSVWIDLTDEGLDEKLVLRSDGTAVYMTQDIGTAIQRVKDFPNVNGMVYTVGNEQDYHFKVLFLILKKLGFDWAENLYHLSYGMVDLPSGKMKSREGTVVDADDLMQEMTETAQKISEELGKLDGYSDSEKAMLYETIGLGALKYYILKVDPKKRILFNPEESVDFAGNTGPFIQYTFARIQSIMRKADFDYKVGVASIALHPKEKELLKWIQMFPEVIQNAAQQHSPALIANYTYDLVKEFNSFYQSVPILPEQDVDLKKFRVQLSKKVGEIIQDAFGLLGINVPERM